MRPNSTSVSKRARVGALVARARAAVVTSPAAAPEPHAVPVRPANPHPWSWSRPEEQLQESAVCGIHAVDRGSLFGVQPNHLPPTSNCLSRRHDHLSFRRCPDSGLGSVRATKSIPTFSRSPDQTETGGRLKPRASGWPDEIPEV